MLKQVREAGASNSLVFRADVIPVVNVDHGQLAVDVKNHLQAIGQRILFKGDLRQVAGFRWRGAVVLGFSARKANSQDQEKGKWPISGGKRHFDKPPTLRPCVPMCMTAPLRAHGDAD